MSDYYTEQLVKQKTTKAAILAKTGLLAATVLSVCLVIFSPIGIILPVIMIVADIFLFQCMDVEFEYLYVNGELDVDKIIARQKRKKVFETSAKNVVVLAPSGSIELQPYKKVKTYNFSSGTERQQTYELVTAEKGQTIKIIFEPNETILEGMKMIAPRKVFF